MAQDNRKDLRRFAPENKNNPTPKPKPSSNFYWLYVVLIGSFILIWFFTKFENGGYNTSESQILSMIEKGHAKKLIASLSKNKVSIAVSRDSIKANLDYYIKSVNPTDVDALKTYIGKSKDSLVVFSTSIANDYKIFSDKFEKIKDKNPNLIIDNGFNTDYSINQIISLIFPFLIILFIFIMMARKMNASGGGASGGPGGLFNIGKSKAQLFDKDSAMVNITFNDVAGLDEAKEEVKEIVDFLKTPKKYTALGGKIPKGALLVGPPGTGKTLLAKAMAGEAQVPFFSLSGSDFVEMFVGVGASRVRDLFKQARDKAPCVIFIDEIDAIGRARGKNAMMSNDERENTLNQLLVEMDGFGSDIGIIILAATNRPDVLDTALLRPGRFDRQITIDLPDLKGREEIFKVHLGPIKISEKLDILRLAEQTPGFAGADIANVCNEAALIAARRNKTSVDMQDFQDAVDRVVGGLEKRNKIISPEEKKIVAYHEAGHAVCGWFLEHAHPLLKVTIVPRGSAALGYAQYTTKEQFLYKTDQLIDQICMTLGGRASEQIFFNKISTGASNDLQQISRIAYGMVTAYGMSDKIGNISYHDPQQENQFTKPYSEETGKLIDSEVRAIIDNAYQKTLQLLTDKKNEVELVAQALLKREVLFQSDVEELIGKRPFDDNKVDLVTETNETTVEQKIEVTTESNTEISSDNQENNLTKV